MTPRRGEIWWGEVEGVGRRPYLVLTRSAAIPVLAAIVCAPLTRTRRGAPSEVAVGPDDGVPHESVVNFDDLRVVPRSHLVDRLTVLSPLRMVEACWALRRAVAC